MFKTIWEKHFLKEILSVFFLFLFSFYFLYVLIDYSTHAQDFFQKGQIHIHEIFLFYAYQFVKRVEVLVPLALLVASIKVLTMLNTRRELVALLTAGISIRTLMRPFLFTGFLCSLFLFFSFECLLPKALDYTDTFHNKNFRNTAAREKNVHLRVWHLDDGSKILYQHYDAEKKAYFDVFWLRSADDIWKVKYLSSTPGGAIADFADHIQRNSKGELEKTESFETFQFRDLKLGSKMLRQGAIPIENRSISSLAKLLFREEKGSVYKTSEIHTHLLYKLLIPLLAIIAPIAVAPLCVQYRRNIPVYLIYSAAIFGYIILYTIMDGMMILAQNSILPAFWALFAPMALCSGWFTYRFLKHS